jgi:hypothetical protein
MTDLNLLKWAVMVQLRRGNPALPPRAKVGTSQRRLDTAFEIANTAIESNPRDWAALLILDKSRSKDPMRRDLADRLARAIWYEQPNEIEAEAWFYLYTTPNPLEKYGFAPRKWEDIYPTDATTQPVTLNVSPWRQELLKCASEVDESFKLDGAKLIPTPCLTSRAVRLVNRIAKLNLPIPYYRGNEYEGGDGLLHLAILRMLMLRGNKEKAVALAKRIGETLVTRSITSGNIYGPGIASGSAIPWEIKPKIQFLVFDSRLIAGVNPSLVAEVESALCQAIA